jgi:hypothetical protein
MKLQAAPVRHIFRPCLLRGGAGESIVLGERWQPEEDHMLYASQPRPKMVVEPLVLCDAISAVAEFMVSIAPVGSGTFSVWTGGHSGNHERKGDPKP